MKVKYIRESNKFFTKGNKYEVVQVDEEGDFFIVTDTGEKLNEYKSRFEIVENNK